MARDAAKPSDSKGKTKAQRHSAVTEARKVRRMNRQSAMQDRPDSEVSANCLKSRLKRRRLQDFKALPAKARRETPHPHDAGERQFGDRAPEYHRLRISPAEYAERQKKRQKVEPDKTAHEG